MPHPLPEVNFLMVEIPTPKPYIFMIRVTRQVKYLIAQAPGRGVIPHPIPEVNFLMVEIPTPKPYIFMIRVNRQIKCPKSCGAGHPHPLPEVFLRITHISEIILSILTNLCPNVPCMILFQIYVRYVWGPKRGPKICKEYQSRDGQATGAGTARQILSQEWNFSKSTPNIHLYLDVCVYIRKEFHGHEAPSFSSESIFFYENATGTGDVIKIWHKGQCQI